MLTYSTFASPIGVILVAGDESAVTYIKRGTDQEKLGADFQLRHKSAMPDATAYVREACSALGAFLDGRVMRIDMNIRMEGTDFKQRVWEALRRIPYGSTKTYTEVAHAIRSPGAFRAVANACASNPIPLIVPCHRVVHKGGKAVGFGWGADAKRYLLEMENRNAVQMEKRSA